MGQPPENRIDLLSPLLGSRRTTGEVFEDNGETLAGSIDGFDHYEALGDSFVIHRIDVDIGGDPVRGLEAIGPYDSDEGAFRTRAWDNLGGEQVSNAIVKEDGSMRFGADGASAVLTFADDGSAATVRWERDVGSGAGGRAWMQLTLTRLSSPE